MRDRLIKLLQDNSYLDVLDGEHWLLAAEQLLANGVIVPPVKVGQTVYGIEKQCLGCIHFADAGYSDWCECTLDDNKMMFECDFDKECFYEIVPKKFDYGMIETFGKTVFLTREEAERALAERSEK